MSLHGNTYQVHAVLVGGKIELVFSPFDLEVIEVRYRDAGYGRAVPHRITRQTHPKARLETEESAPAPATAIAYLQLVADADQQLVAAEERIGFHALYSTGQAAPPDTAQLPGQLSIDHTLDDTRTGRDPHRRRRRRWWAGSGGRSMSIQRLQAHLGFTRMPFGRALAPSMLHRHSAHAEDVARIGWCIDQHAWA